MAPYDREYLEEQFEGLSPKAMAIIALRAAMRVFPVLAQRRAATDAAFWFWPPEVRAHYTLAVCRCFQSSAFVNSLTEDADAARSELAEANRRLVNIPAKAQIQVKRVLQKGRIVRFP
jgi:hypothetical protein